MTAASIGPHRCICGRGFAKRSGLGIHQRTCQQEPDRSAAFVAAFFGLLAVERSATPTQRLLQARLGSDLAEWVKVARRGGTSWADVAAMLTNETGETVSAESLRRWYR